MSREQSVEDASEALRRRVETAGVDRRRLDAARTRSTLDLAGRAGCPGARQTPAPWAWAAEGAPVALPVHRLDADHLPAVQALLLRPDDVVARRGTDVATPPRALRELLGPGLAGQR